MAGTLERELAVAIDAVRYAGSVCETVHQQMVTPTTIEKKDRSPVTIADLASQAIVCAKLNEAFPDDPIIAEEEADELRRESYADVRRTVVAHVAAGLESRVSEEQLLAWIDLGTAASNPKRFWTLDPIDGTKGFLRREQYAVALALIEDGQVVLGVLGCPNLSADGVEGLLFTAVRGQGARQLSSNGCADTEGTPVHVSDIDTPARARFCESVESGHSNQDQSVAIAKRLGMIEPSFRMDSQCKYAAVARGDAQIYMRLPTSADYREKIWDHAAGMIVVEEAGGKVTDVAGQPLDFTHGRRLEHNRGIIASNGRFHSDIVGAVQATLNP